MGHALGYDRRARVGCRDLGLDQRGINGYKVCGSQQFLLLLDLGKPSQLPASHTSHISYWP